MKTLAQAGSRWFCKPPEGFDIPCLTMRTLSPFVSIKRTQLELKEFARNLGFEDVYSFATASVILNDWINNNGSTIFVDSKMAESCKMVDVVDSVRTSDIKKTLPFCYFKLSKKDSIKVNGFDFSDCLISFVEEKETSYINIIWIADNCLPVSFILDISNDLGLAENLEICREEDSRIRKDFGLFLITKQEYYSMTSLVVNFILLMQSYPEYLTNIPNNDRKISFSKIKAKPKSFVLARSKKRDLQQKVIEKEKTEISRTHESPYSHWRKGHWRRQEHGNVFEQMNPHIKVAFFEDGRRYHMTRIEPIFVIGESFSNIQNESTLIKQE